MDAMPFVVSLHALAARRLRMKVSAASRKRE